IPIYLPIVFLSYSSSSWHHIFPHTMFFYFSPSSFCLAFAAGVLILLWFVFRAKCLDVSPTTANQQ
ncbi:hypothetical protein L9F63_022608, partial [Diploptera punctata]